MNVGKLEKILKKYNQPKFRLEQIKKAVFQDGVSNWEEITTISKDLRNFLQKELPILSFEVEKILKAKNGQSVKALLKLKSCHSEISSIGGVSGFKELDSGLEVGMTKEHFIETVLMSPKPNAWSVCISSQAGCPMIAAFARQAKGDLKGIWQRKKLRIRFYFGNSGCEKIKPHPTLSLERRGG